MADANARLWRSCSLFTRGRPERRWCVCVRRCFGRGSPSLHDQRASQPRFSVVLPEGGCVTARQLLPLYPQVPVARPRQSSNGAEEKKKSNGTGASYLLWHVPPASATPLALVALYTLRVQKTRHTLAAQADSATKGM